MPVTHDYLTPDIFDAFRCKCGACRANCCRGWTVTLSLGEYYRLLGLPCPASWRRKLDDALYVLPDGRDRQRFARLDKDGEGRCRLQKPDGLCGLQCTCGETALPAVCRMYPRGPRSLLGYVCANACSCEAVVEQLMAREEPMTFRRARLSFPLDAEEACLPEADCLAAEAGRMAAVRCVQDRSRPLAERLIRLTGELAASACDTPRSSQQALDTLLELLRAVRKHSAAVDRTLNALGAGDTPAMTLDDQQQQAALMASRLPRWEVWLEQLLVNHMTFTCFPDSERRMDKRSACLALDAVYALLRLLALKCADEQSFADMAAALFRHVEHSDFALETAAFLRAEGFEGEKQVSAMLLL